MAVPSPKPGGSSGFLPRWGRARRAPVVRVVDRLGDTARVALCRAVQGPSVTELGEVLADLRARGCLLVEVDLTGVTLLSREAVWVLFDDAQRHEEPGGLRLHGASGQAEYILGETGLARVLS